MTRFRLTVLAGCMSLAVAGVSCGGGDDGGGGDGALTAPTELTAMVVAGPAVHLTWKDIASEHHFTVERKQGAGAFMEIDTTLMNKPEYHDANKGNAFVSGPYTYRIAGSKADGTKGPYSSEATVTLP